MASRSVYLQRKHRRIIGMVEAVRACKCFNCGGLAPARDIYKGWCPTCLSAWGASANAALIEAARAEFAQRVMAEPPTAKAYERLKARIAERPSDTWFIPMTLYIGNYTIGQAQANWNFLQAMYELEIMTTAHAFRLGQESHDLLHLCGRHAAMQQSSLGSFLGRVVNSPEVWRDVEPRMKEYIREFVNNQGGNFSTWLTARRRISPFAERSDKTRRPYRIDPNRKTRAQFKAERKAWDEKWAAPTPTVSSFWPFAVRQAPDEHTMLATIDRFTRGIPEQWRQDVCQDLVVAVLSGEATLGNLQDALPKYVAQVFRAHPIKYGNASLDAPVWAFNGSKTLGEVLALVEQEDREDEDSPDAEPAWGCGWHAGFDRPVGLASVADVARKKADGVAIQIDEEREN